MHIRTGEIGIFTSTVVYINRPQKKSDMIAIKDEFIFY